MRALEGHERTAVGGFPLLICPQHEAIYVSLQALQRVGLFRNHMRVAEIAPSNFLPRVQHVGEQRGGAGI